MTDDNSGGLRNTVYRQETTSRRTMTPARRFAYRLLVPVAAGIIRACWALCREPRVVGLEHLERALAGGTAMIPVYWHQHQLFCAKVLLEQRSRGLKIGFLISPSVDGEIGAMLVPRFGGEVIRGSSSHTGARALRDYYEALAKRGISPVITPDGPRGPRFVAKPGAVLLSQMSGRPILPMAYAASRAILFHWDKFVIPWPFSRIVVAFGEPLQVPRAINTAALEQWQLDVGASLKAAFTRAHAELGKQS